MVHLPIHDDLITFKKGLRNDVKALFVMLTGLNMPTTIDAYIAQAIAFDNSLHAQAQDLKVKRDSLAMLLPIPSHAPAASSFTPRPAPRPAALTNPVPMEIDALRHHGPVSHQEHERRREQGLCAYCRGKHKIDTCKALAKRNTIGGKKTLTSFSQQGKAKPEAH